MGVPFSKLTDGIKRDLEKELDSRQQTLTRKVMDIFDEMIDDFDSRFVVKEVHNPQIDELRGKVREFTIQATAKLKGLISEQLEDSCFRLEARDENPGQC